MPENLKDIPTAWYATGLAALGAGFGWMRSAFKAGRATQKLLDAVAEVKADVDGGIDKNGRHFEKIYDRLGDLGERIAAIEGQKR